MKNLKNNYCKFDINDSFIFRFFLYLLPLILGFNIVYHLYDGFAYIGNFYSNYYQIYIHIVDIFVLIIAFSGLILNIKKRKFSGWQLLVVFLFILVVLQFNNADPFNLYFSSRLFLYSFCCWIVYNSYCLNVSFSMRFFKVLIFSGVIQSVIACLQFFLGRMLGISWLGESQIQLGGYSASVVNLNGSEYLRGYGTFPHPNVLGGFLVFVILAVFLLLITCKKHWQKILYYLMFSIVLIAITITWSRSSWIALVLAGIYLSIYKFEIVKKGVKKYWILGLVGIFLILGLGLIPLICSRLNISGFWISDSFSERLDLIKKSFELIKNNEIWGIGDGNFVRELIKTPLYTSRNMAFLQPVHNIPLLIFVEFGLIGFSFFIYVVVTLYRKLNKKKIFWPIFIIIFTISMLDHYFYTLPQGLGLIVLSSVFIKTQLC